MDKKELSFEKIYEDFSPGLRIYLSRITASLDADDLCQDVFEKVNRELDTFKGLSSVKTWIYKIATNMAYDRLRALSSKKQVFDRKSLSLDDPDLDHKAFCHDHAAIDSQLIRKQMSSCVQDVVETLEEPYKTVLILKDLENFKNREIAQILQISLENVKIKLHRGRKKLKEKLKRKCDFVHDERNVFVCIPKELE